MCSLNVSLVWVLSGFQKDPLAKAIDDFEKKYPNVLYDFNNINHRIFIGQSMAKYLRE